MFDHICSLIDNLKMGQSIGRDLERRIKRYSSEAIGAKIEAEIDGLLGTRR